MARRIQRTLPLQLAMLLAAGAVSSCGGGSGGGSPPPPPPPTNSAPTFTSAASVSALENSGGTIYTATASDADGNSLSYSLAGGADQAAFQITSAGALTFASAPDFEVPTDADGNNIYLVRIGVSDGQASATLDLAVTITNSGPDAFRVTRVGVGFAQPLFVAPVPDGTGRVYIVEKGGRIRILNPSTGAIAATPFLDLSGQISTDGERGLLGFATAPDFATTGTFYVYLTNPTGTIELRRYRTFAANREVTDGTTADVLLTIPHPGANNHNGGWIGFGPDGFLYLAVGDGGGSGDPSNNAQNTNVLLGKMLRIDVNSDAFGSDPLRDYAIPAGNPFAASGGRPEIWAYGLRNPFRNSFDGANLWIADVGQNVREEIDLMRPGDGGANYGWRVLEGTSQFTGPPQAGFVPPVAEYSHGTGAREGDSITGGYVYRGPVEALRGQYIFGDFVRGNIWSLPIAQVAVGTTLGSDRFILRRTDFTPNAGAINNVASFGLDQNGNLYIVDFDGEIFRIEVA
jgi:glucose/arabinose dehydrogenase